MSTTISSTSAANPRRWLALAVIATATLMVVLDASIVNIALPQAQAELRISDANRHWVITAYALAFGGCSCSEAASPTLPDASGLS